MPSEALEWVDSRDFLQALSIRNLTFSGNEATFSCFSGAHAHGDSSPSAGMNLTSTRWQCRHPSCGLKGNAADFLAKLRGYTREQAMRILAERYGGPEISTEPGALEQEVERIRNQREVELPDRKMISEEAYLDRFAFHWPHPDSDLPEPIAYMYGRGFSPETLNNWVVGFDDLSGRIAIPIHDENGQLVGIKGRACRADINPRYISIGDAFGRDPRYGFNTYMKSQYVFGLHRARERSCITICYSLDTEVLTPTGWRLLADITTDDQVLQYETDGTASFVSPTATQRVVYDGEMINVKSDWCDLLVTPDHRLWVGRSQSNRSLRFREVLAQDARYNDRFPTSGRLEGGEADLSIAEALLLVAWAADGCRITGAPNRRCWNLKKVRKKRRLEKLLDGLGATYRRVDQKGCNRGWTMYWVEADSVSFLDRYMPDKCWHNGLLTLPLNLRDFMLHELGHWDGDFVGKQGVRFFTGRREEADAVSAIAASTGWGSGLRVDDRPNRPEQQPQYVVNLSQKPVRGIAKTPMRVSYSGDVVCCTVPSGWLVVRRCGKTMVAGNCEGELNAVALDQIGIDAVAIAGAEFSPRQRELIVSKFSEVILYFDNDLAGHTATQKVGEMLSDDMAVYIAAETLGDAADALDPSKDFSISELKQAVVFDAKSFLEHKLDLIRAP